MTEGKEALEGGGANSGVAATVEDDGENVGAGGRAGRDGDAVGGEVEHVRGTDWGEDGKPM